MRVRQVVLPLACVVSAAVVTLGGCNSAPSGAASNNMSGRGDGSSSFNVTMAAVSETDYAQQHQFYYYPNAQVYRDCDENRWIWSKDGGLTWRAGAQLPLSIALGNEIPFAITLGTNEPAVAHQTIAAAYPPDEGTYAASVRPGSDPDVP